VNANGLIYGSPEESRDYLPVLDPVHSTTSRVKIPYRDPDTPGQPKPLQPSAIWGDEAGLERKRSMDYLGNANTFS